MARALSLPMRATLGGMRVVGEGFSALFEHAHRLGLAPPDAAVRIVSGIPYGPHPRQAVDVYLPAKPRLSTRLPTLVFVHGGGWIACNRKMSAPLARTLAARGFAVVTPGYRLLPQCQRADQRADVRAAFSWLMKEGALRFDFDLSRLVVGGESAGAHLVMRTVQGWDPSWPKPCGILGMYGMYDVQHLSRAGRPMFEPVRAALSQGARFAEVAQDHSALRPLPWCDVPVLLLHGEADVVAPVSQSQAMHAMLLAQGHDVRLHTYAGGAHGFIYDNHPKRRATARKAYRETLRFLLQTTGRSALRRSRAPLPAHSVEAPPVESPADPA